MPLVCNIVSMYSGTSNKGLPKGLNKGHALF